MKKNKAILTVLLAALLASAGCDDLINGMDSFEWMNEKDTARGMGDFVAMNLNSTNGSLVVEFPGDGVAISLGTGAGCMDLEGQASFPYSGLSWETSLHLTFNDCQSPGADGSVFNGIIDIRLSGLQGSVSRFDFKGLVDVSGSIEGKLDIDLSYAVDIGCLTGWDCWDGTVNGHGVEDLWNAYSN